MAAFDSKVIAIKVAKKENETDSDCVARYKPHILRAVNMGLKSFNLVMTNLVSWSDFRNMTSSRHINKFMRVKRKQIEDQKKEAEKAQEEIYTLNIGHGARFETFKQFGSTKYAQCSIAMYDEEYIVVWMSFHTRLYYAFKEFQDISFHVAKVVSDSLSTEASTLGVTSFTRHGDEFVLFYNGKKRHQEGGKGALTKVKDTYNLDINGIMDAIDLNITHFYAPSDYARVIKEQKEQKEKFNNMIKEAETLIITDKKTGENMVKVFTRENQQFTAASEKRINALSRIMKEEPKGTIVFFTIDEIDAIESSAHIEESKFYT